MDVDESRTKTTSAALWQGANKRKARVIDQKWFLNMLLNQRFTFTARMAGLESGLIPSSCLIKSRITDCV